MSEGKGRKGKRRKQYETKVNRTERQKHEDSTDSDVKGKQTTLCKSIMLEQILMK